MPGDRASDCFGRLVPAALEHVGGEAVIQYLCDRCGHRHRCRAHSDDSQEALRALAGPRDPETAHRLKAIALPERVARFSEKEGLLQGRIGVAVSGGVDSMVLLHVLVELGHRPLVLSVDHGIRPESADELRGVEQEAKKLGLDFLGSSLSLSAGPDLALRAREARHAFFREADVDCVALAHHRDDQVETILDRLMRGAGAGGLGGMAPRRDHLVRPLLEESRAMIEAWAGLRSIDHFEDPSNKKGTRGRIRHELLPLMKELREGSSKSILRSAQHLQEDDQLLRAQAEALLTTDGLALHDWEQAPAPIKRRAVLALVRLARGDATDLGAAQLDQVEALSQPGGLVALSDGWRIVRDSRHLRCLPCLPEAASIKQGVWGLWQVSASKTVLLRSIETGEQGGGTPLRERLRAAGIGAALRPFHPLVEFEGRRWLPGVWLENQEEAFGVTVQCERPPRPSIPPGGPYTAAL